MTLKARSLPLEKQVDAIGEAFLPTRGDIFGDHDEESGHGGNNDVGQTYCDSTHDMVRDILPPYAARDAGRGNHDRKPRKRPPYRTPGTIRHRQPRPSPALLCDENPFIYAYGPLQQADGGREKVSCSKASAATMINGLLMIHGRRCGNGVSPPAG